MERRHISKKTDDKASLIASFFLGVAATLFILLYWFSITNIILFSFLSLATLIIFLTISALLSTPKNIQSIIHVTRPEQPKQETKVIEVKEEPKEEKKYIGSTQTNVYHKNTCRFGKSIKPEYRITSNEKSFFKKYKSCGICKPDKN